MGWAIGRQTGKNQMTVLAYGAIQTAKSASMFDRYRQIQTELQALIEQHHPSYLAIEELFFSKNTTTALRVSEVRGLIIASCLNSGMKITEYNPSTIKLAVTGHGRADKAAVDKMVRLQLGIKEVKVLDDTMDALAVLITHSVSFSSQDMVKL